MCLFSFFNFDFAPKSPSRNSLKIMRVISTNDGMNNMVVSWRPFFVSLDRPRLELVSCFMRRTLPEMLAFIDHEKSRGAIPSSGATGISRHGMLAHSMISARRVTSSYSFQNAFFYLQFPDDPIESKSAPRVLKKTRRKAKFNPQKQVRAPCENFTSYHYFSQIM